MMKASGSFVQAAQMASKGVFHRRALSMLSKVVGGHEGEDMSLQTFEAWIVEDLDGRLFDRWFIRSA